mgnify:CR=1 FL=1
MLEDRLGLRERLELAVDIFGLVATRSADDLLGGAIQDEQEAGLREALTRGVLTPADGGVDLVAAEDELAGEGAWQVEGVNTPVQLAVLERTFQLLQAQSLMRQGVRLADPARLDVRGELVCGADVEIDVNCIFQGNVSLGQGVKIGANCVIANCTIEAGAVIHPFTHIDGEKLGVTVGEGALIGPFARLRPGAQLAAEVHIGNFVEVKNSTMAKGAKANHLAYLGDATVGERVNYGAGSITANYDGANKHRTVIGDSVRIGSDTMLVAPVTIGDGAYTAAGSVITEDVPPGAMAVARARQKIINGWVQRKRPGSSSARAAEAAQGSASAQTRDE